MNSFSSANHLWERKTIILGATGNPQRPCSILVLQLWERRSAKHYSRPLKLTSLYCTPCFLLRASFKFLFKNLPIFKSIRIRKSLMSTSDSSADENHQNHLRYVSSSMCSPVPQYQEPDGNDFTLLHTGISPQNVLGWIMNVRKIAASLHCWDKGASFPCKPTIWVC